jgi:CheY-like chemotaxis protein
MDPKRLRLLFVDDEQLDIVGVLKAEGYDVEYWPDVESLEKLTDGRYHVLFLDVRGIGSKYGGNGLDVLKYVSTYNPLIYSVVFSAKPFNATEGELVRQHARHCISKDCTAYEVIDLLHEYAKGIDAKRVLAELENISLSAGTSAGGLGAVKTSLTIRFKLWRAIRLEHKMLIGLHPTA